MAGKIVNIHTFYGFSWPVPGGLSDLNLYMYRLPNNPWKNKRLGPNKLRSGQQKWKINKQACRSIWHSRVTNLTKRWVFKLCLNALISLHNLISFSKQVYVSGPCTANAGFPKESCLYFGTCFMRPDRTCGVSSVFEGMMDVARCLLKTINSVSKSVWYLTGNNGN